MDTRVVLTCSTPGYGIKILQWPATKPRLNVRVLRWEISQQGKTLLNTQAAIVGCNNVKVPGLPERYRPVKEVVKVVGRLASVTRKQIP